MLTHQLLALLIAALLLVTNAPAHAQSAAAKKGEEKKASRWSLADWLDQKKQNQLADMWLARNSHSSPFEFYIGGEGLNYTFTKVTDPDTKLNKNAYGGSLAAYAGLAGLRGSYESDNEERSQWSGSFNLRILGRALQDTHLNLEYGLKGLTKSGESFQNQYGAAELDVYLTKYFGIEGVYRKTLPAESDRRTQVQGDSGQAGVFIEFGLLRVYGHWKKETLKYEAAGATITHENREGFGGGLRFYF